MRDAARELEWCSVRLHAVLLYWQPSLPLPRLIGAIYAVDSDAETVAGCSNTLVRGVQNVMQLAMLVSYMPLGAQTSARPLRVKNGTTPFPRARTQHHPSLTAQKIQP